MPRSPVLLFREMRQTKNGQRECKPPGVTLTIT